MLKIKLTKNGKGIELIGDYEDFDELQDVIYDISDSEYNTVLGYESFTNFLLSLAYDVRHAKMGTRKTQMMENGSSGWNIRGNENIPKENLYYKVNITMVTCISILLAIQLLENNAMEKRKKIIKEGYPDISKPLKKSATAREEALYLEAKNNVSLYALQEKIGTYDEKYVNPYNQYQKTIKSSAILNVFKELMWDALLSILDSKEGYELYQKIEELPTSCEKFKHLYYQYFEFLDIQYITAKTKKERLDMLPIFINHMINLDDDYIEYCDDMKEQAKKQHCSMSDLHLNYPEVKNW